MQRLKALYEESIAVAELAGNKRNKATVLNLMAILVSGEGAFETAKTFYEESITLWREVGHGTGIALVLNNLANIYHSRGDYNKAEELFEESLALLVSLATRTVSG